MRSILPNMDFDVTASSCILKSFGDTRNAKIVQKPEYSLVHTVEKKSIMGTLS